MDEKTIKAAQRVEEITAFYVHAVIFAIINLLLILINVTITDDIWWAHWVIIGWGIGLAAHGFAIFGHMPEFVVRLPHHFDYVCISGSRKIPVPVSIEFHCPDLHRATLLMQTAVLTAVSTPRP